MLHVLTHSCPTRRSSDLVWGTRSRNGQTRPALAWPNSHVPKAVTHTITRSNAVLVESGDVFRDTVALTVRGDGVDIPPYTIMHTYRSASLASEIGRAHV